MPIKPRDALKSPGIRLVALNIEKLGARWTSPDHGNQGDLHAALALGWVSSETNGLRRTYSLIAAGRKAAAKM